MARFDSVDYESRLLTECPSPYPSPPPPRRPLLLPPPLPLQLYMVRLGTFDFETSDKFVETIASSGMGAMEMFAMGLKGVGSYLARTLSYHGAEFTLAGEEAEGAAG